MNKNTEDRTMRLNMNCCRRADCRDVHCPSRVTYDSDGITVTEHYCEHPAVLHPAAAWTLAVIVVSLVGFLILIG